MSNNFLFPKRESSKTSGVINLPEIDIDKVADKIIADIRALKLDNTRKVDIAKDRIAKILMFYKRKTVDQTSSTCSERDVDTIRLEADRRLRKSISSFFKTAKTDTNVIRLYDQATAKEMEHAIHRQVIDEGFSYLKDETQKELQKMNDSSKALTLATKSAIQDYLTTQLPKQRRNSNLNGKTNNRNGNSVFEECDEHSRKMVENAKYKIRENMQVLLTNPTGKKMDEEMESEEFVVAQLSQFHEKLKRDLNNRKAALDQTVNKVKSKTQKILPLQYYLDDDDENEQN